MYVISTLPNAKCQSYQKYLPDVKSRSTDASEDPSNNEGIHIRSGTAECGTYFKENDAADKHNL